MRRGAPYARDGDSGASGRQRSGGGGGGYGPVRDRGGMKPDPKVGKERPGRTLFVRNISYNVPENTIKELLEKYGEIKRLFNLVEKRGMAFVTFYDTRAAEAAKQGIQGLEFGGRTVDVHFALPKDEGGTDGMGEDDKNTGTLFVTFRNVTSLPSNIELKTYFEKWGEVREVRDCKNSPNQKFVEYYDLRDCEAAFNANHNADFHDGTMDIKYAYLQSKKDMIATKSSSTSRSQSTRDDGYRRGQSSRPNDYGVLGNQPLSYDQYSNAPIQSMPVSSYPSYGGPAPGSPSYSSSYPPTAQSPTNYGVTAQNYPGSQYATPASANTNYSLSSTSGYAPRDSYSHHPNSNYGSSSNAPSYGTTGYNVPLTTQGYDPTKVVLETMSQYTQSLAQNASSNQSYRPSSQSSYQYQQNLLPTSIPATSTPITNATGTQSQAQLQQLVGILKAYELQQHPPPQQGGYQNLYR